MKYPQQARNGEKNPNAKLTDKQVLEIANLVFDRDQVRKQVAWHKAEAAALLAASRKHRDEYLRLRKGITSNAVIGKQYGVSQETVYQVAKERRTWRHLPFAMRGTEQARYSSAKPKT